MNYICIEDSLILYANFLKYNLINNVRRNNFNAIFKIVNLNRVHTYVLLWKMSRYFREQKIIFQRSDIFKEREPVGFISFFFLFF